MEAIFHFPFKPYHIQEKFMKELYLTIENEKLGIFESPTGTGKSLSICCGALQWLRDNNLKTMETLEREIKQLKEEISNSATSEDWLQEEYEKVQKIQMLNSLQSKFENIKKKRDSLNEMRNRVSKQKSKATNETLEIYFKKDKNKKEVGNKENLQEKEEIPESSEDGDLILEEVEEKDESDDEAIDASQGEDESLKIYISSRTHSQLSQFIGEIKKTVFKEETRVVTLASRQHYCINPDVNRLKNVNLINERCLDLQKSKTKSTSIGEEGKVLKKTKTKSCSACPYYNQGNITRLKERMLVDILDMEDLVKCGKELKACPYYASRMALDDAEVVLVSHAGVVSAGARSGVSLKLQNNILILDEAHGLTAALENAHSAPVSLKQLTSVKTFLQFYVNKYRSRLSSINLLSLNQLSFVIGKLLGMIKTKTEKKQGETTIFTPEDFVIKAEIDHINLRPLVEFCKNTRLAPKLHGFSMRYSQQALEEEISKSTVNKKSNFQTFLNNISKKKIEDTVEEKQDETKLKLTVQSPSETSAGSGLYAIVELLSRLCERSANGRVLASCRDDITSHLKYLLLNPAEHFAEVVNECRSVIVAGGTMEPLGEFKSLLTRNSALEAVTVVRCDHVVPPDNVLAVCLSRGPTNVALNFSFENRNSNELLCEIGRILRNVCTVVPGGVVCFLPSYSYEQTVYQHMHNNNIIQTITKKKSVFREPKSASEVDQVLHKFASAVRSKSGDHNGALLLSVVGGKLSEGLNFSDELGRCVIVIGMPYPNVKSPELQEKMSYLNRTEGGAAGNAYYENLCMKAVNQCIGRAVRHANDYACVLLVDERYSRPQTISALPSFVQIKMLQFWSKISVLVFLLSLSFVASAPAGEHLDRRDGSENKSDVPVEQLEKLKMAESAKVGDDMKAHVEFHRLDAVKANGELVSRLEQHASADSTGEGQPLVQSHAQLDVPSEGVHRVLVQDGSHVSVIDGTAPTAPPNEEPTTKVFHGAARLVQPGSATNNPANGHTAVRRAFNADIMKETNHNVDHYAAYSGVQYSPLDMAEYVFWTGDEVGVTTAVEEFLQEGMMTKEEAIAFLQEIKFNIDYLRAHYTQNMRAAEESAQQEKLRTMLMEQAAAKEYQYRNPGLQSFPFGSSPDIVRTIASKSWELNNNLSPIPALPLEIRPEPVKRYDPMLQTNIISTSDYDRDGPIVSEEEYEEMMDKLKAADNLYTEYTLEEIIYQLSKMMFSQSLSRDPASARAATQRFMAFLELEAERGQLSRTIEKKVLDVMIAALSDTVGDHPELLQSHETLGSNRLMRQFLEASVAEPSMSRAILAAYKDELLKGPPLHKFSFDRN